MRREGKYERVSPKKIARTPARAVLLAAALLRSVESKIVFWTRNDGQLVPTFEKRCGL